MSSHFKRLVLYTRVITVHTECIPGVTLWVKPKQIQNTKHTLAMAFNTIITKAILSFLLCLYSKLGNLEKRKEKIRKKKRFMAGDWTSKIPIQIFTMGRLKVAKYYFTCAM